MPAIYFIVFLDIIPLEILLIWLFFQIVVYIIHANITQDFLEIIFIEEDSRIKQLLKYQLITIFINALLWGIATSLTVIYAQENIVLMMVAALFIMLTISIAVLTPVFHAIFIFIVTTIIIFMGALMFLADRYIFDLSIIFLLAYLAVFIPVTFKVYEFILTSIKQKEEILLFNYSLEKKISAATIELEKQNIKLSNSVENFQILLDTTM